MAKDLGAKLNPLPSGKSGMNQVKLYSKETPIALANQDEGRPGRQKLGSETVDASAEAFNRHRAKDTPNTSSWKKA